MPSQPPIDPRDQPVEQRVALDLPEIYVAQLGKDCESFEEISHTAFLRRFAGQPEQLWPRRPSDPAPITPPADAVCFSDEPDLIVESGTSSVPTQTNRARLFSLAVTREPPGWRIEVFLHARLRLVGYVLFLLVLLAVMGTIGEMLQIMSHYSF